GRGAPLMAAEPLPFEKDIHDLEVKLESLEAAEPASEELKEMRKQVRSLLRKTYDNLTPWQTVQVSRHPQRPQFLDYVDLCFDEFLELHGDRSFGDDRALRCGFARLGEY